MQRQRWDELLEELNQTDPDRCGSVVGGRYRLERRLGSGGTAHVYAATDIQTGGRVAIKTVLRAALRRGDVTVERFAREARAAARIHSDHVLRVLELGTLDDGLPFLVMEYVEGTDLAEYVAARGPLPFREAVVIALQICDAIAAAHASGILHRDVKPANVLVVQGAHGVVCKVLDFGYAKLAARHGSMSRCITDRSIVFGSPGFMAPEQMRSMRHVDTRSDVWSLGALVYFLLTARMPFDAPNVAQLLARIDAGAPPRAISSRRLDVPRALEQAIVRALAREPDLRFQTVASFARALENAMTPERAVHRRSSPKQKDFSARASIARRETRHGLGLLALAGACIPAAALAGALLAISMGRAPLANAPLGALNAEPPTLATSSPPSVPPTAHAAAAEASPAPTTTAPPPKRARAPHTTRAGDPSVRTLRAEPQRAVEDPLDRRH